MRLKTVLHRPRGRREAAAGRPRVLVVGPGDHFLSGVSYYNALLATALSQRMPVAVLLLRRLCPRFLYPGRARVGTTEGVLSFPDDVPVYNGLDWFWGLSALRAWRFYRRHEPAAVVLQWWTGTVLHSYLALAWLAKRSRARVVVEFHEVQDIGEAALPLAAGYARIGMRLLLRSVDAVAVHSEVDRGILRRAYPRLAAIPLVVVPHGPYAQYATGEEAARVGRDGHSIRRPHVDEPVRLLIFGVVRPYKGHAELTEAARLLVESGLDVHVTVVGEVWQGYREPLDRLAAVLPPNRLDIVDRYVPDHEVSSFFARADVVVLPYHRSSASGPLHIAMSCGLPVVTTAVGGLVEASAGYTGVVLVPPRDAAALARGIQEALPLVGERHTDPHSWSRTADRFGELLGLGPAALPDLPSDRRETREPRGRGQVPLLGSGSNATGRAAANRRLDPVRSRRDNKRRDERGST